MWAACSDPQSDFTSARSLNLCNGEIPVCSTEIGCILDNSSYTSGTFPGSGKFAINTAGPATVELHFFLINPSAGGNGITLTWYEAACQSSFQQMVGGPAFVAESQSNNEFVRSQALGSQGDHLITFQSDATTNYLVKAVVIPTM